MKAAYAVVPWPSTMLFHHVWGWHLGPRGLNYHSHICDVAFRAFGPHDRDILKPFETTCTINSNNSRSCTKRSQLSGSTCCKERITAEIDHNSFAIGCCTIKLRKDNLKQTNSWTMNNTPAPSHTIGWYCKCFYWDILGHNSKVKWLKSKLLMWLSTGWWAMIMSKWQFFRPRRGPSPGDSNRKTIPEILGTPKNKLTTIVNKSIQQDQPEKILHTEFC